MKCPDCKGDSGEWNAVLWRGVGGGEWIECGYCNGTGKVLPFDWLFWWLVLIPGEKIALLKMQWEIRHMKWH